jgi:hypothetical protein
VPQARTARAERRTFAPGAAFPPTGPPRPACKRCRRGIVSRGRTERGRAGTAAARSPRSGRPVANWTLSATTYPFGSCADNRATSPLRHGRETARGGPPRSPLAETIPPAPGAGQNRTTSPDRTYSRRPKNLRENGKNRKNACPPMPRILDGSNRGRLFPSIPNPQSRAGNQPCGPRERCATGPELGLPPLPETDNMHPRVQRPAWDG